MSSLLAFCACRRRAGDVASSRGRVRCKDQVNSSVAVDDKR